MSMFDDRRQTAFVDAGYLKGAPINLSPSWIALNWCSAPSGSRRLLLSIGQAATIHRRSPKMVGTGKLKNFRSVRKITDALTRGLQIRTGDKATLARVFIIGDRVFENGFRQAAAAPVYASVIGCFVLIFLPDSCFSHSFNASTYTTISRREYRT